MEYLMTIRIKESKFYVNNELFISSSGWHRWIYNTNLPFKQFGKITEFPNGLPREISKESIDTKLKRDERRQIIPPYRINCDKIWNHQFWNISPEMLPCDARRAARHQFRYCWAKPWSISTREKWFGAIFGYHGHLEDTIDDPFHSLYEAYKHWATIPLYEDKETMPGEWYIDILAVYPGIRRHGIGRKLLWK